MVEPDRSTIHASEAQLADIIGELRAITALALVTSYEPIQEEPPPETEPERAKWRSSWTGAGSPRTHASSCRCRGHRHHEGQVVGDDQGRFQQVVSEVVARDRDGVVFARADDGSSALGRLTAFVPAPDEPLTVHTYDPEERPAMFTVNLACPGTRDNSVIIKTDLDVNQGGLNSLTNTGTCPLFIGSLDSSGRGFDDRTLEPGAVIDHNQPSADAVSVYSVCHQTCDGTAVLIYDDPDLVA